MEEKYYAKCYIEGFDIESDKGGYKKDGSLGNGCYASKNAEKSALESLFNKYRYRILGHPIKGWVKHKSWNLTSEYNEVLVALLDSITWNNDTSENSIGNIHVSKVNLQENHLMMINRAMGIA